MGLVRPFLSAARVPAVLLFPVLFFSGCVGAPYRPPRAPGGGPLVRVAVADGWKTVPADHYRGKLVVANEGGKRWTVNHLSLEDYTRGTVPGEVPASWDPEALKAMAIVARSYAWAHSGQKGVFDLLPDVRDQHYCARECEKESTNKAVDATAGMVLYWDGRPLSGFNHSCCAGGTEDVRELWGGPATRPLGGVTCRWCQRSRHYGPWTFVVEKESLAKKLEGAIGEGRKVEAVRTEGETPSGRVRTVVIITDKGEVRVPSGRFRLALGSVGFRSARFTVHDGGTAVSFAGTGWGHGVGMCQEGAQAMARSGRSFEYILQYYFPGAQIVRAAR